MVAKRISQLDDGGTLQSTDDIPVRRGSSNFRVRPGTMGVQSAAAVAITGGAVSGVTVSSLAADLAVGDGGTGASDAAGARTNLGLAIGSNVQAYASIHDALVALEVAAANGLIARTAANTLVARSLAAGDGIAVTNPAGTAGNPTIARTTIDARTADIKPDVANDYVESWDASASTHKKVRARQLSITQRQTVASAAPSGSWQTGYYFPYGAGGITAAAAMTAQRENWIPSIWSSNLQFAGMGIWVGTGVAATSLAMAAYYRNEDGSIGAQIGRGTVASTTNSTFAVVTWTGVDIEPGAPIWLGIYSDGAPSLIRVTLYFPFHQFPVSSDGRQVFNVYRSGITLANAYPVSPPAISAMTASLGTNTIWMPAVRAI